MADAAHIENCVNCLETEALRDLVDPQCLPVPWFGNLASSAVHVATVGINPSSMEFYNYGAGPKRPKDRLPMLSDFSLGTRTKLRSAHVLAAKAKRDAYFLDRNRTPNKWFESLSALLDACGHGWNYRTGSAVHLDIVACVTTKSWSELRWASEALKRNCSDHFRRTLALLPPGTMLLLDGRSACDALLGAESQSWEEVDSFTDVKGRKYPVRFQHGCYGNENGRFAAWNLPAKYLPPLTIVKIAALTRASLTSELPPGLARQKRGRPRPTS
jgi:hypothetical protein